MADTQKEHNLTGYPSVDKPWLRYYSEKAITDSIPDKTIFQYIWENNKDNLSDTAINYYGTKISYGHLFEKIRKAASAFYVMGVRPGDIVTIMSMHTPEALVSIYAANMIGAVANMVYMTLSGNEIAENLRKTDSKLFLVLDVALDRVISVNDEINCPVVILGVADSMPLPLKMAYNLKTHNKKHDYMTWHDLLLKSKGEVAVASDFTAPAIIVYTSGTTGEPKGVVLSSENLNSEVAQLRGTDRNYKRKETVLMILPPFIIFGASMSHLGLSTGIEIIICIQLENDIIGKMFNKYKPNRYVAGPMYLEGILRHVKGDLNRVIDITGGGDAITSEQEAEINEFLKSHGSKAQYFTGYGMSEVSAAAIVNMECANRAGSLGVPLPKTNVKIVDTESGEELAYGKVGEICFCSPGIMQCYYNNEEATNDCIDVDQNGNRWLHTGDLGSIDKDGFVFFKGRIKRIYMTLGTDGFAYKLFPQRIEEFFERQDEIETCGVIVKDDVERLHTAHAFVTLKSSIKNQDSYIKALKQRVQDDLPEHLRPDSIKILDSIPVTPSGKIDYKSLEQSA